MSFIFSLIFKLKQVDGVPEKIMDSLKIPTILEINLETCPNANSNVEYSLQAIVFHIGNNISSGHYTSCCRNQTDHQWRYFDDETVEIKHEQEVEYMLEGSRKQPYLLFYEDINFAQSKYFFLLFFYIFFILKKFRLKRSAG